VGRRVTSPVEPLDPVARPRRRRPDHQPRCARRLRAI